MDKKYISVLVFVGAIVIIFFLKHEQKAESSRVAQPNRFIQENDTKVVTELPMLLEIGSSTCVPCKMMAPILEELMTEQKSKLRVKFIDIKNDKSAAQKYNISLIPTQIFYDAKGREFFRHEGFYSKKDILDKFESLKTVEVK
jgi:thioredoxin 1